MTLHPWPLNDIGCARDDAQDSDHVAVLWTGHSGRGLLADSPAVPLCFLPEAAKPTPMRANAVEPITARVFDASAFLRLRDIRCRFGTSA